MSEPADPDLAQLAKRYVELWQDYLTAAAADPETIEALARLVSGMGAAGALWAGGPAAWAAGATAARRAAAPPDDGDRAAPPRAAAAAAASGERDDRLADLARRLALVEERLAALDAGARRGAERARGAPRRRRS